MDHNGEISMTEYHMYHQRLDRGARGGAEEKSAAASELGSGEEYWSRLSDEERHRRDSLTMLACDPTHIFKEQTYGRWLHFLATADEEATESFVEFVKSVKATENRVMEITKHKTSPKGAGDSPPEAAALTADAIGVLTEQAQD